MTMGIYVTKAKWQKGLGGVVAWCVRMRLHPDVLTYGALALSLVAAFALASAESNRAWLWLVLPCVSLRLVFNLLDGQVARASGLANTWGEVKNEFGDRLADAAIFLGFCFSDYVDVRLAALTGVLVLCVSYLGILGKAIGGERIYGGMFGKGDRMISLALFTLLPLSGQALTIYNWYLALATIAALVTIIQRLKVIYEYSKSVA
jgi:CDP-diacylglycerol--glycerol-3-phosphate 3-phosphatidyltransferase